MFKKIESKEEEKHEKVFISVVKKDNNYLLNAKKDILKMMDGIFDKKSKPQSQVIDQNIFKI